MKFVVDASVAVHWVLDPKGLPVSSQSEVYRAEAFALLDQVRTNDWAILQPPHWLAEVAELLARAHPGGAEEILEVLDILELPVRTDVAVLQRAVKIAQDLDHHVLDTLYHAVALEADAFLVTADNRYLDKALHLGRIVHLAAWQAESVNEKKFAAG